ncbi:hypothetical protein GA0061070_10762 [Kosakonia oryziphila]|uniref:Uncharacterized protein n=1 Tax=Kosakonia oryziphila TaxID=1005667 RepID=A0A1C4GK00_9ENTR|nr:hypothetical protein GA0061070_10762 [Kosakonia oryziphila]
MKAIPKTVSCCQVVNEVWDIEMTKIKTHKNTNIRLTVSCSSDIEYG